VTQTRKRLFLYFFPYLFATSLLRACSRNPLLHLQHLLHGAPAAPVAWLHCCACCPAAPLLQPTQATGPAGLPGQRQELRSSFRACDPGLEHKALIPPVSELRSSRPGRKARAEKLSIQVRSTRLFSPWFRSSSPVGLPGPTGNPTLKTTPFILFSFSETLCLACCASSARSLVPLLRLQHL